MYPLLRLAFILKMSRNVPLDVRHLEEVFGAGKTDELESERIRTIHTNASSTMFGNCLYFTLDIRLAVNA